MEWSTARNLEMGRSITVSPSALVWESIGEPQPATTGWVGLGWVGFWGYKITPSNEVEIRHAALAECTAAGIATAKRKRPPSTSHDTL